MQSGPLLLLLLAALSAADHDGTCVAPTLAKAPGARFCAQRLAGLSAVRASRCKTLHLVRHAEGTHNEAESSPETLAKYAAGHDVLLEANTGLRFWDARLTPKGEAQCRSLRDSAAMSRVRPRLQLVVSSPFTRTLQTAFLAIGRADAPGAVPHVATELIRERIGPYTCDGHRTVAALRADFPGVDFAPALAGTTAAAEDRLFHERKEHGADERLCQERIAEFVAWVMARDEAEIAVVAHKHALKYLLALVADDDALTTVMGNAELRSMVVCDRGGE